MCNSDEIREYVLVAIIKPARRHGYHTVELISRDIHKGMGLRGRYHQVCTAIDAKEFTKYASVKLVEKSGPEASSSVKWKFELLPL